MDNDSERDMVVAEARRWIGTPYHHRAKVFGVGVDCAQLLLRVYTDCGLIARFEPEKYTPDWHFHQSEERYLSIIETHAALIDPDDSPLKKREFIGEAGDLLMFKVGKCYSHSAIISKWPYIIHASLPAGLVEEVDIRNTIMAELPMRAYSYWGKR